MHRRGRVVVHQPRDEPAQTGADDGDSFEGCGEAVDFVALVSEGLGGCEGAGGGGGDAESCSEGGLESAEGSGGEHSGER